MCKVLLFSKESFLSVCVSFVFFEYEQRKENIEIIIKPGNLTNNDNTQEYSMYAGVSVCCFLFFCMYINTSSLVSR